MKRTNMVALISLVSFLVAFVCTLVGFVSYRLGYCNACDEYIEASECKPMRSYGLFTR